MCVYQPLKRLHNCVCACLILLPPTLREQRPTGPRPVVQGCARVCVCVWTCFLIELCVEEPQGGVGGDGGGEATEELGDLCVCVCVCVRVCVLERVSV